MSNSNQKQLLMSLADYWRSTNGSWIYSKKSSFVLCFFSAAYLYRVCAVVLQFCCAVMLYQLLFFKTPTLFNGVNVYCAEFLTLMKFYRIGCQKKKSLKRYERTTPVYIITISFGDITYLGIEEFHCCRFKSFMQLNWHSKFIVACNLKSFFFNEKLYVKENT